MAWHYANQIEFEFKYSNRFNVLCLAIDTMAQLSFNPLVGLPQTLLKIVLDLCFETKPQCSEAST
ncbi:hypothetical protein MJO28_004153 [Puccinia striiformis f. sp. tritici]|uniref:Uncharacterized protein n=2 Tax=Puccinia striiformis f. sp. tritici TaxID=168172 RepID=A0ACC0EPU7_9BASI|nr:hypothetical protein MJO28_004135 [Puccinia striiformis f. sp. tritici]KAI7957058.1 hypothetical protein MJO28_004153 [Puccinia striiformis f. sp. tritici]